MLRHRRPRAFSHALSLALLLLVAANALADDPSPAPVTLRETTVFVLKPGDQVRSAKERAKSASRALEAAADLARDEPIRVTRERETASVIIGTRPVIELSEADAKAAGSASLDIYAQGIAAKVRDALARERARASMAKTVFSISLVVCFGLITLYLIRKLSELSRRARDFILEEPERVPALRLRDFDVVSQATVRDLLLLLQALARFFGALGLLYAWLLVSLSLFESTRPYTERLTGLVLSPLYALVARIASMLPVFILVILTVVVVAVMLRVVELFLASVARGETTMTGVPADLAESTSIVIRTGLIVVTLLFAGPVITGDQEGALSRTGTITLIAFALSAIPLLCSAIAGLSLTYTRAIRRGARVQVGGEVGFVRAVGLLFTTLEAEDGSTVRVPHLRTLFYPTRTYEQSKP